MTQVEIPSADAYRPGVCNIGPAEVKRRRRSAAFATIVTLAAAAVLVALRVPSVARLALFPFAVATAITWLQVARRFCVAFGAAGLRNFGPLGAETSVADRASRMADRRTTFRMLLEGVGWGVLVTGVFLVGSNWLLPS
jgi:hypothetical protein